jgi:hypothetical protein
MQEYWRLTLILAHGESLYVLGEEEEMRGVLREFQSGESFGRQQISGITDTADRAPMTLIVDFEAVVAATIVRMY